MRLPFRRRDPLTFQHAHVWRAMGVVNFTQYGASYHGLSMPHDQPALILACDCGEYQWKPLYAHEHRKRYA